MRRGSRGARSQSGDVPPCCRRTHRASSLIVVQQNSGRDNLVGRGASSWHVRRSGRHSKRTHPVVQRQLRTLGLRVSPGVASLRSAGDKAVGRFFARCVDGQLGESVVERAGSLSGARRLQLYGRFFMPALGCPILLSTLSICIMLGVSLGSVRPGTLDGAAAIQIPNAMKASAKMRERRSP